MTPITPNDDLDASDTLLVKADALIHRHRSSTLPRADDLPVLTDVLGEDLPVLEDIADEIALDDEVAEAAAAVATEPVTEPPADSAPVVVEPDPAIIAAAAEAAAKAAREEASVQAQAAQMRIAEQLIEFDAHIAQTLESWISNELPQIVAAEVDGMVERLRIKTLAHMRATLVPDLSHKLSELLDATLNTPKQD
ncbi:hypothetical protein [Niveibacterium microcysteis]|uniref:Uncharacterized protein n=1 Tax=Niveibacterium microcysteis TaxID=2811415 RepID=A0ABX7MBT1_9RHOO|nr:hypothetical protein [Niveibacterium microcysteis]QSI78331.1 hypothetical protein JY500_06795 [Niveibacterium microcysteis]